MALENKLGMTNSADLAREEERISKKKALELFESGLLDQKFVIDLRAAFRKGARFIDDFLQSGDKIRCCLRIGKFCGDIGDYFVQISFCLFGKTILKFRFHICSLFY